ncbi:hypothetical protein TIFTF001_021852 [Ficus carica]|uniref:Uncharacterized protein n=1 Tax=Ficus carica TaxID=3494 RepID=A0AA88ABC2_FICCA|nr:hypothetical protein TIFTF001_021852 [Ficus carica]
MMLSKFSRVVPTCHESGFGPWFELDWAGLPNHSMAARHNMYTHVIRKVVLARRKLMIYVYVVGGSLQSWYQSGFPAVRFPISAASATIFIEMDLRQIEEDREASLAFLGMEPRPFDGTQGAAALAECWQLVGEARIWWLSLGDPEIPKNVCMNFRALIILRYGPLPGEGPHYRDPDIYRDMYMRRYISYVAAWKAYPNKSMDHYRRRFRDAMLPYVPLDIERPMMQALYILRDGLPPEVSQFTPPPTIVMTLDKMIDTIMEAEIIAYILQAAAPEDDHPFIPVDDAGNREPVFHDGPFMLEEPILAVPIQAIPPQEEDVDVEMDPANPGEDSKDPSVIIIVSDDEEEIEEGQEELEEDPEEILFDDDDWDADSEIFSDVMTE